MGSHAAQGIQLSKLRRLFVEPRVAASLFIAWYFLQLPSQWQPDSYQLYLRCIRIVDWHAGKYQTRGDLGVYPIFQYLSGVASVWAASHGFPINIFWVWSASSAISFAAILIIMYRAAARIALPGIGWLMVAIMLSGYGIAYVPTTWNELVAAALILWFTDAVTELASPSLCAIIFYLCGITKEILPPFLMTLWLVSLMFKTNSKHQRFVHIGWLLLASAATYATNAGFNLFRFGSVSNLGYWVQPHLVHLWQRRLNYGIGIWLSPNGGVLFFWPTLVAACLCVCALALKKHKSLLAMTGVVVVLAILTVGLSGWFSPFGWFSWGPRLMLPWLPALTLILLKSYPAEWSQMADLILRRRWAFIVTCGVFVICALPHLMSENTPDSMWDFFEPDQRFPQKIDELDAEGVYAHTSYLAWHKYPLLFTPFSEADAWHQLLPISGFLVSLMVLLRQSRLIILAEPKLAEIDPAAPAMAGV